MRRLINGLLLLAILVLGVPFGIHMAHGAPIGTAAGMTGDDLRVAFKCPDRGADIWRFVNRDDLSTSGDRAVRAVCEERAYAASPSPGGSGPSGIIPPSTSSSTATPPPAPPRLDDLTAYALELINNDRADHGAAPVGLGNNAAAQQHAEDMLENYYIAHWDTGGYKPYMRYTLAGGEGAMAENAAYSGFFDPGDDPDLYVDLEPRDAIRDHEFGMMYDDAHANWGHRDNIIAPGHQLVNLGIAFDDHRLAYIQHFEQQRVTFVQLPAMIGPRLTMSGVLGIGLGELKQVAVYRDPLPQQMSPTQLNNGPRSYSVGEGDAAAVILRPLPPGFFYPNLGPQNVVADIWEASGRQFSIEAAVGPLARLPGVYTVLLFAAGSDDPLTTFSIFVR